MQSEQAEKRNRQTILIVDDEPEIRRYLGLALGCRGFNVEFAEDGIEALEFLRECRTPVSAVVLDVIMPRKDGIATLSELRRFERDLPVIMLSSACSPCAIVDAMRNGANDFLPKPVSHDELWNSLRQFVPEPDAVEGEPASSDLGSQVFWDGSGKSRELDRLVRIVGPSDFPVLIQGETGSGKEVIARRIHENSNRANQPFVKLNCAALPPELIESELFGYERGAFTGAFQKKAGMFEAANHGTLMLDEIGDMDFKLQAKLLQVLQDQTFHHLGGRETISVDVRVLAATHRDLEHAISERTFREDLYYRLNVLAVHVPALRERQNEIIPLAEFLLRKHAGRATPELALTRTLKDAMLEHSWPGNVRELENMMRRYLVLRDPEALLFELRRRSGHSREPAERPALAPKPIETPRSGRRSAMLPAFAEVERANDEAERQALVAALETTHWNRRQAASLLGLEYKAILYKIKRLGIQPPDDALFYRAPSRRATSAAKEIAGSASAASCAV